MIEKVEILNDQFATKFSLYLILKKLFLNESDMPAFGYHETIKVPSWFET